MAVITNNFIKTLILVLFLFSNIVNTQVWVYPGASDSLKSKKYFVRIMQDESIYESFVYLSKSTNEDAIDQLTINNHWTNFSFEDEIEIEITKLFGDPIRFCILRPKNLQIKPDVSGYVIKFKLENPQNLFFEINEAEEDPLFIFADGPENKDEDLIYDTSTLYFGPGIHDVGYDYIVNNKNIYIEGGAYVKGSFIINGDKSIKISGRGILSGIENNALKNTMIHIAGSADEYTVEGITFTDGNGYGIYSENKLNINNVKILGWSDNSKGIFSGDSSSINHCFFKVDNDIFTFNHSFINVSNCVIWQQANGAPFQFSSYNRRLMENIEISDIDIVRIDLYNDSIWTSDKTIINCLELNQSILNNILIENLRVEGNVNRLIGINTGLGGLINNFTLKDVKIEGVLSSENFISAYNGSVDKIVFDNIEANYTKITNEYDAFIEKRGNVGEIKFTWRNY